MLPDVMNKTYYFIYNYKLRQKLYLITFKDKKEENSPTGAVTGSLMPVLPVSLDCCSQTEAV
jgi:hypothetical protein